MIKILKYLFLFIPLSLLTWSCHNDKENDTCLDELVNLTVSLKLPHIELKRSVSDDPRNESGTWSELEELVDGRKLYHVTLFLIESTSKRLVGIRDIKYGSDHITDAASPYGANGFSTNGIVDLSAKTSAEATFTFKYDHPRHGECEKLRRGEFLMLAVANYTAYGEYNGLKNGSTALESLINSIKETFDTKNGKGIDDFVQTNSQFQSFFDFPVTANDDYLCDKFAPQPLSMVQTISLNPGENQVSVELKRIYSRIRIELINNSSSCDLTINSLDFDDNFVQKQTYLFENPNAPDRIYTNFEKGKPVVSSASAIASCSATTDNPVTIEKRNGKVIFDAYVLGSKKEDGYHYTLDVEYKGKTYELPASVKKSPSDLEEIENNAAENIKNVKNYFLIQNTSSGKYLFDNDNWLYQGNDKDDSSYMWALLKGPAGRYYFCNKKTGHYIGVPNEPTDGQTKMITAPDGCYYRILLDDDDFLIQANDEAELCLNNYGGKGTHLGGWKKDDGGKHQFYLAIPAGTRAAHYNTPILLETIDPITAQVNQMKNIKRNDFINVLVTVAFDEMNGDFGFMVTPWSEKNGEIEFN